MKLRVVIITTLLMLVGCGVNPAAENNRANQLLRSDRFDVALTRYQAAQVADPNLAVPYFNTGVAFLQAEQYPQAALALQQALQWSTEPNLSADIHYALGEAYFRQGNYRQAVAEYREVLRLRPDDDDARYNFELAVSLIPTATPLPSPTQHEGNQDSTATPTSTPTATQDSQSGDDEMTNTPTPPPGGEGTPTLTPQVTPEGEPSAQPDPENESRPNESPPMSPEDALQLLDDVQDGQAILPQRADPNQSNDPSTVERDW
ncbi:MAG: tetratricopeptide repeat protein [Phototrophicaceae bacterium]|jgi:tetratricopeptide (TPR) repeat protein